MTYLKNTPKEIEVEFDYMERSMTVSIYRIQRETSAYSARHYKIYEGDKFDKMLSKILIKPEYNPIFYKQGKLVYKYPLTNI